jgi:hypothetical protein
MISERAPQLRNRRSKSVWAQKGLLLSRDNGRETLTVRRNIAGTQRNVLNLKRTTLLPQDDGDSNILPA